MASAGELAYDGGLEFRGKAPEAVGASDWIVQRFTSPPTQYRLYGRRFLQVKRPNQQYQSTEEDLQKTKQTTKTTKYTNGHTIIETQKDIHKISTASPLVYTNMG